MKQAILALLEKKFPGARKDVLTTLAGAVALQVESEDAAKEIVDRMTADKVEAFSTSYRREIDREVQQGVSSNEKKLRETYNFTEKIADTNKPQATPQGGLTFDQIKELFAEQLAPLNERINAFDRQRVEQTRSEQYLNMLNEAKLPKEMVDMMTSQFAHMTFEDDAKFQQFLAESKPGVAQMAQHAINASLRADRIPNFGGKNEDGVSSAVTAYLNQQNDGDGLGGKKV